MRRAGKSRNGQDAAVMDAPARRPPPMSFKLWDTFGASDVAPEISVEHPGIGQRSYFPESEYQVLDSSIEGLELSIDGGAWQPCRRCDGCWSFDWTGYQSGRRQAVVRVRPRRSEKEPRQTCLFLVDLP
ncbi:MAG: hypothetical protein PHS14_17850 [Elusimicrobia bacterium]|nr:hypothetical protein [Elusimicrobiota bacterium]